jgi:hypothetical protein
MFWLYFFIKLAEYQLLSPKKGPKTNLGQDRWLGNAREQAVGQNFRWGLIAN